MEGKSKFLSKFNVFPLDKFEGDCPYFREPSEVGHFSLDINREFLDDNSRLRLYSPPEVVDFDLKVGYREFVRRDEDKKERLDDMLRWIKGHPEKFRLKSGNSREAQSLYTDFVTWRGHMTKIFCTPYETKDPWQMAGSLLNGTIYVSEVETEKARQNRLSQTQRQDEMCYWGYKFEDYTTSPISSNLPDTKTGDSPVNNKEAFCTVVRGRLHNHSLVYGAEVDCCIKGKPDAAPPLRNYVELKTSRIIENERMNWSFERYKLLKWWSQSFLAGVPKIVCGFRNDEGVVKRLKTFNTLEIPTMVAEKRNMWSGSVCLNFCDQLLDWLKSLVKDEGLTYMLHWREPFTHVELEISRDPRDIFLPEWYTGR